MMTNSSMKAQNVTANCSKGALVAYHDFQRLFFTNFRLTGTFRRGGLTVEGNDCSEDFWRRGCILLVADRQSGESPFDWMLKRKAG